VVFAKKSRIFAKKDWRKYRAERDWDAIALGNLIVFREENRRASSRESPPLHL
jgi:hypothetical protein